MLLCGCAKSNGSVKNDKVTSEPTNKPTSGLINSPTPIGVITPTATIAPTITIAPTFSPEKIAKAKEAEKQKAEAIQVTKNYFIAVKEHNKRDPYKYLTKRLKDGDYSNVKDAKLISISNKDGKQFSYDYKVGTGADTNPYKVISFEVTYSIQYIDDKKGSEPGGKFTKWFTLVKDKDNSPWQIAEIGY